MLKPKEKSKIQRFVVEHEITAEEIKAIYDAQLERMETVDMDTSRLLARHEQLVCELLPYLQKESKEVSIYFLAQLDIIVRYDARELVGNIDKYIDRIKHIRDVIDMLEQYILTMNLPLDIQAMFIKVLNEAYIVRFFVSHKWESDFVATMKVLHLVLEHRRRRMSGN